MKDEDAYSESVARTKDRLNGTIVCVVRMVRHATACTLTPNIISGSARTVDVNGS